LEGLSHTTHLDADNVNEGVLRIKCYREPASLRGSNYDGKYITLGWYTYDRKIRSRQTDQLWGAENSVIIAPCSDEDGTKLKDWFNSVFDSLWEQAESLKDAVDGYPHDIDPAWLDTVSRFERPRQQSEMGSSSNGSTASGAQASGDAR